MACHPGLPRCKRTNDARCTSLSDNSLPLGYEREVRTKLHISGRKTEREWYCGPSLAPTG
eukprot:10907874-Lingulodinium_polyedra.AAC.1